MSFSFKPPPIKYESGQTRVRVIRKRSNSSNRRVKSDDYYYESSSSSSSTTSYSRRRGDVNCSNVSVKNIFLKNMEEKVGSFSPPLITDQIYDMRSKYSNPIKKKILDSVLNERKKKKKIIAGGNVGKGFKPLSFEKKKVKYGRKIKIQNDINDEEETEEKKNVNFLILPKKYTVFVPMVDNEELITQRLFKVNILLHSCAQGIHLIKKSLISYNELNNEKLEAERNNYKNYKIFLSNEKGEIEQGFTSVDPFLEVKKYRNFYFTLSFFPLKKKNIWRSFKLPIAQSNNICSSIESIVNIEDLQIYVYTNRNLEKAYSYLLIPPDLLTRELHRVVCKILKFDEKKYFLQIVKEKQIIDLPYKCKYKTVGYVNTYQFPLSNIHLTKRFELT